jgi:mannitol-1-phosphate 5-dehydrogenase
VFVEVAEGLVQKLRQAGEYRVNLVGTHHDVRYVDGFTALGSAETEQITREVESCAFAATAVGGPHLEAAATFLVAGIMRRATPLKILVCENWPHADQMLSQRLCASGVPPHLFSCIRCSVEPMTVAAQDSLDLLQEEGQSLFIDVKGWEGPPPSIEGMSFTDNIEAFYARKLYTNNAGHAVLAYDGALLGCDFIYEALAIPSIRDHLIEFLDAASEIMIRHFGLPVSEVYDHVRSLVSVRYANRELGDTVARVGRDPLRKLGPEERLVGLLRLLQSYSLPTSTVSRTIAAAVHYADPGDLSSVKLAQMIRDSGVDGVLQIVCGLRPPEVCYGECLQHYQEWGKELS